MIRLIIRGVCLLVNVSMYVQIRHSPQMVRPHSALSDHFDRELLNEYRADMERATAEPRRNAPDSTIFPLSRSEDRADIDTCNFRSAGNGTSANVSTRSGARRKLSRDSLLTQTGSVLAARGGGVRQRDFSRDSLLGTAGASRSAGAVGVASAEAGDERQQWNGSRETANDSASACVSIDGRRSLGAATVGEAIGCGGGADTRSICERRSVESLSICSGSFAPHSLHQQNPVKKLSDPFLVVPLALANLVPSSQHLSPIHSVGQSDLPAVFGSSASPSSRGHSHSSSHSSLLARLTPTFVRAVAAAASEAISGGAETTQQCPEQFAAAEEAGQWRERAGGNGTGPRVEGWPNPLEREGEEDECIMCNNERRTTGLSLQRSCDFGPPQQSSLQLNGTLLHKKIRSGVTVSVFYLN